MTEAADMKFTETSTNARSNLRAEFYREGKSDYISISIVGDPNVYRGKVTPGDIVRFPREWEAYQKGRPADEEINGTPITDVPGITKQLAAQYKTHGVRTAEELAALNDMACSRIGLGAITHRKAAQNLIRAKQADALEAAAAAARPQKKKKADKAA
jgi:hypothetical protein